MSGRIESLEFVLPKHGFIYSEQVPNMVLCKPKLLPLKSITLQKLEQMQKEAGKQARFHAEMMAKQLLAEDNELPNWAGKEDT